MKRDSITVNDRQLACAHVTSQEGQDYLKGMAAAGNYAWVNRSSMTFLTRQVRADQNRSKHHKLQQGPKCGPARQVFWFLRRLGLALDHRPDGSRSGLAVRGEVLGLDQVGSGGPVCTALSTDHEAFY